MNNSEGYILAAVLELLGELKLAKSTIASLEAELAEVKAQKNAGNVTVMEPKPVNE